MLEFSLNDFQPKEDVLPIGLFKDMSMGDYRKADGLSNSELQLFKQNSSSYIWSQKAPVDSDKVLTAEFGTALHMALLEPELYEGSILVSDTKGRTASAFLELQRANRDKIVLTENEYRQIDYISSSAMADPMFAKLINFKGDCEVSIFVEHGGLRFKIRPDKVMDFCGTPVLADVKTTANLDDWRNPKPWINPLFKLGYGFTAAYYMFVASLHYGIEMDKYTFLVVQKSAELGRYPVSTFVISRGELMELGFWDELMYSLELFAKFKESGNFAKPESFPKFELYNSDEVDIKFSE